MKRAFLTAAVLVSFAVAGRHNAALSDDGGPDPDQLFKKLDANGDGKLTASEVPPEHQKVFQRLVRIGDLDKNGELSRAEFDKALQKKDEPVTDINQAGGLGAGTGKARPNLEPQRIFRTLDKNKDGKLTADEVSERPRIKALFERSGKDEMTLEDFQAAIKSGLGGGKGAGGKKNKKKQAALQNVKTSAAKEMAAKEGADALGAARPGSAFFEMLDANHDGRLSREELAKAGALFDRLDKNQDGFLDTKELLAGAPANKEEMAAADDPLPKRMLRPGKGKGKGNGQNMLRMIMKADADGDGKISMEEAPPQLKQHFEQLDTNSDGFLDKAELEAGMQLLRRKKLGL